MDPLAVLESTGRRRDWVAGQMGISESYLSLLLNGKRRWNDDVRRRFALATGVPLTLIVFGAADCDIESDDVCDAVIATSPAEAPSSSQAGLSGSRASVSTREAGNGSQGAR